MRKYPLVNNEYYHVFNRSISKYVIFNNETDYSRIMELIDLNRFSDFSYKYSDFCRLTADFKNQFVKNLRASSAKLVDIISYSIMPTHIHLTLKQLKGDGISKYMARIQNSYTRHFNILHHRKGPLWEGKFKNIHIKNDEQILHLTRYHHLNAVSAGIVEKPEDWIFSSYQEYLGSLGAEGICDFKDIITLSQDEYGKFVTDQIDYQRKLAIIKYLTFDNYVG